MIDPVQDIGDFYRCLPLRERIGPTGEYSLKGVVVKIRKIIYSLVKEVLERCMKKIKKENGSKVMAEHARLPHNPSTPHTNSWNQPFPASRQNTGLLPLIKKLIKIESTIFKNFALL